MKTVKLISLLACLLLMLCLVACQNSLPPEEVPTEAPTTEPTVEVPADPDAIESYTVYVSADATVWERKCAEKLISLIEAKTGVTLTLNRDASARTACEIIVTGQPADAGFDADKIGYNGYAVKREGNKLTLAAAIENGMLAAVDYVLANAVADGKMAESCDVLVEQNIELVTPDPDKHINVSIDADTGYDIYQ
ncbi:MAG: hypothetical protein IKW24_07160, partial [Clostridia bacterium]|nr:hypothetical protein [Clostridia bacterium]